MLCAFLIDKIKLRTHVFFVPIPTLLFAAYEHGISQDISWLKDKYISINQCFTCLPSMLKSVGKLTSVSSIFEKKNFFLTISIETLTFKNALLHIEKKSY